MATNQPRKSPAGKRRAKGKPAAKPAKPGKPGDGFLGWLGRQVGHVKKAVQTDVTKPAPPAKRQSPPESPVAPKVIYRDDKIEEIEHPTQPGVKLRRTIIDEVIVEKTNEKGEK